MEAAKFKPTHKANLKIITNKIVEHGKHVPRKSTGGFVPRKIKGKPEEPKYEPLPYENKELNKAFENLVTLCINGRVHCCLPLQ